MRVVDVIRSVKTGVAHSAWADDKLKPKDFPLSKKRGRAYPLTRRYRWQIISFSTLGHAFRVLAAYHTEVPEFVATLAQDVGSDCRILARWEFHGSHAGWHVHTCCEDADDILAGLVKPFGTRRIPDKASYHRHTNLLNDGYDMQDAVATAIACSFVGLPYQSDIFVKDALPWS